MTLPFDYSRCVGMFADIDADVLKPHPLCNECRRREPGHPERQPYIAPAIEVFDGEEECRNRIAP